MISILLVTFEIFVLDIKLYMTLHNTNNLGWLKFTLCRLTKHKKNFTALSEVEIKVSFSVILFLIEFNLTLTKNDLQPLPAML